MQAKTTHGHVLPCLALSVLPATLAQWYGKVWTLHWYEINSLNPRRTCLCNK